MSTVPGAAGYAQDADRLIERYEAVAFAAKHRAVLHLLPALPCDALDIGAGSGADAAWLASHGHRVVAVEPTDALRRAGMALHASAPIEWIDDGLPLLTATRQLQRCFDLVMISAVWMHLDAQERRLAMPHVAGLLARHGLLTLSLRHGPGPSHRRLHEVSAQETITLARRQGLRCLVQADMPSVQAANRAADVTWTHLAFAHDTTATQPERAIDRSMGDASTPIPRPASANEAGLLSCGQRYQATPQSS